MTFESSRSKGLISTLLLLLLPIIIVIISVAMSLSHVLPKINPYVSFILMIPSFAAYILFLSSMKDFAKYYGGPDIFKNSLYAFVVSTGSGIASLIGTSFFITPILDQLTAYISSPGSLPPTSIFFSLFQVLAFIWIVVSVIGILNGLFYRRAFNALAEKSGEQNFKQAGLFMFLGGILTIVFVGGLIFFIGLIFAVLGFFSIKPKDSQTHSIHKTS